MWTLLYKLSIVVAAAGHGADLATTEHCLGAGTCRETNVALMRFENPITFGAVKMGVGAGGVLLVDRYKREGHTKKATLLNFAQGIGFAFIARHNNRIDVQARP